MNARLYLLVPKASVKQSMFGLQNYRNRSLERHKAHKEQSCRSVVHVATYDQKIGRDADVPTDQRSALPVRRAVPSLRDSTVTKKWSLS